MIEEIHYWFEEAYPLIFVLAALGLLWLVPKIFQWITKDMDVSRPPREHEEQ